jgi:hypothetical protein
MEFGMFSKTFITSDLGHRGASAGEKKNIKRAVVGHLSHDQNKTNSQAIDLLKSW